MAHLIYERDGIYIEWDSDGLTIKKNGLTIEIPEWVIKDFEHEFGRENLRIADELRFGAMEDRR